MSDRNKVVLKPVNGIQKISFIQGVFVILYLENADAVCRDPVIQKK